MHITRLRLLGFKSFVEPAELIIERGLTGVVGPNGCGKSNLLEGLRWVMGETSYKNMRASSMEDVIFSGTNIRPARNIAEVTMTLDNRDRTAHPAFNDDDNLQIVRRIERDSGSQYHINGKPVRARDVQLLFADASTGSHSPALVQQGRIGEIVSAKPVQRRFILEEAAGITGLHSRRHEAEIKLRGAENNMERLLDIIGEMESQYASLQRQERQVQRYRKIQREIEQLTILQLYLDFLTFQSSVSTANEEHQSVLLLVGEKTAAEAQIRQMQIKASERLPGLREREMVTAAILQRLNIESDQLEREQQSLQNRKNELISRSTQFEADQARETTNLQQDLVRLETSSKELQALETSGQADNQNRQQAAQEVEKAQTNLAKGEQNLLSLRNRFAEQKAERNAMEREIGERQEALSQLQQKTKNLQTEQEMLAQKLSLIANFDELNADIETSARRLQELETLVQKSEREIDQARRLDLETLQQKMEAQARFQTLSAQISTLKKLLQTSQDTENNPVLDDIEVTPGYETALGAALGDDLEASINSKAELYWRETKNPSELPQLPEGIIPLQGLVKAPDALSNRLAMTGVVERGTGDDRQLSLLPGQRLVSVEGDLWRWDGFIARADAPTNAARRLAEKNRLENLQTRYGQLQHQNRLAEKAHMAAHEKLREREVTQTGHKNQLREQRIALDQLHQKSSEAERQAAQHKARLEVIITSHADDLERAALETQQLARLQQKRAGQSDLRSFEDNLEQETSRIAMLRTNYHEIKTRLNGLELAERHRLEQISKLRSFINHTKERIDQSQHHLETLKARHDKDRLELKNLNNLPEQTKAKREALNDKRADAGEQRTVAADALQESENTLREIERSLTNMQNEAASAREQRAGCNARLDAARTRLAEQIALIETDLQCAPEDCLAKAGYQDKTELPEKSELETQIQKLGQSRERLGNVNLRADEEAREVSQKMEEMSAEHTDLVEAIEALRSAISNLNREGRRRLLTAFNEINGHFESLFTSLFGGGKAKLELIESDDPLQAGLEIIASPPGKKPQVLTLLSGGEKALTALSLIFAVFLTNPAPICVLDEVDAPLDDANVERFCTLLDEMTKKTKTRFLVITHHPTTMAHMDRLFGVTMAEKGISQLVSVDLTTAERFRETA